MVNVQTKIEPTIHALPRLQKKTETIPVKLKRMKGFKHAVATENVRPHAVMAALQILLNTIQLYKEADITVDDKWNVDDTKLVTEDSTSTYQPNSDSESDTFSEIDDDNETPVMTLLDEQSLDKNEILSVAPGERQNPLSIFKDSNLTLNALTLNATAHSLPLSLTFTHHIHATRGRNATVTLRWMMQHPKCFIITCAHTVFHIIN